MGKDDIPRLHINHKFEGSGLMLAVELGTQKAEALPVRGCADNPEVTVSDKGGVERGLKATVAVFIVWLGDVGVEMIDLRNSSCIQDML